MSVGPEEAARAVLAAEAGGDAVASVLLVAVEPPGVLEPGRRLLVLESGEARGTLGGPELDRGAAEAAREVLAGGAPGARTVEAMGARCTLFVEAHVPPDELVIVGAGHIAVPLAELGAMLGFRLVVLDDRKEFATAERFPEAARVERIDIAHPFRGVRLGPRSYIVLATRAHRFDFDILSRLLDSGAEPRYVGMIGSRRRVRAAFQALVDAGVEPARLERVRAPIGVDIGAETPAEIAVSIAAELVAARRGVRPGGALADRERVATRLLRQPE